MTNIPMAEDEDDLDSDVASLDDAFERLSRNAADFYLSRAVPEEEGPPDPWHFYRRWVTQNRPVVFRNATASWPAVEKWESDVYLRQTLGSAEVTVSVTPDGYADALAATGNGLAFVMPHEEKMTMGAFLETLGDADRRVGVHYIQKQNSNLADEFSILQRDVVEPSWARKAFGKEPDAVNFWMGDGRAVTSTHKDPYENVYCVVRGYKDVTLFPPTDLPWLTYQRFRQAKYTKTSTGGFAIEHLADMPDIPWIAVDPLNPDFEKFPEFRNASPVTVRVNAGDALYLPSYWFHHLRQSHGCIAVNFWYDMDYDVKWNYFQFLNDVVRLNRSTRTSTNHLKKEQT